MLTAAEEKKPAEPGARSGSVPSAEQSEAKKRLRREKLQMRRMIPEAERPEKDSGILKNLRAVLSRIHGFSAVVGYMTDGTEPDLKPLLRDIITSGIPLILPRFLDAEHYELVQAEDLELSDTVYGIPEPPKGTPAADSALLAHALWLVPGVAFDESCNRLGRGKGVYDRLLCQGGSCTAIGIFYECQKCDSVPCAPHDRPLDYAVTECGVYRADAFRSHPN